MHDRKSGQKKLCRAVCVSALVECEMRTERDRKHRLLTNCLSTHILVSAHTPVRPVTADTICRQPQDNSKFLHSTSRGCEHCLAVCYHKCTLCSCISSDRVKSEITDAQLFDSINITQSYERVAKRIESEETFMLKLRGF